jgi:hypothetical protein
MADTTNRYEMGRVFLLEDILMHSLRSGKPSKMRPGGGSSRTKESMVIMMVVHSCVASFLLRISLLTVAFAEIFLLPTMRLSTSLRSGPPGDAGAGPRLTIRVISTHTD